MVILILRRRARLTGESGDVPVSGEPSSGSWQWSCLLVEELGQEICFEKSLKKNTAMSQQKPLLPYVT